MDAANQRLLDAAHTQFARNGYKKTSVADIAATTGVAVGSVYKFYPSKKELFFEVYFAENARMKRDIAKRIDWKFPRAAMLEFMSQLSQATARNKILGAWNDPQIGPALQTACSNRCETSEFQAFLTEQSQRWRDAGLIPHDCSQEFLEALLDAANKIDTELNLAPEVTVFIYEAMVEKLFA